MAEQAEGEKPTTEEKAQEAAAQPDLKEAQKAKGTSSAPDATVTITQPETFDREYVQQLRAEAAKNRKAAQEAVAKVEEYEEREKTETQKAADKAAKADARAKEAELTLLRFRVAADKQVPPSAVEFLQGENVEELEASADKLLKLTRDSARADFDGGARPPEQPPESPEQAHNRGLMEMLGIERSREST